MRWALFTLVVLLAFHAVGCKKTPTESRVQPPEFAGSYVGWGRPGGTGFNVALVIDSTSNGWQGTITYGGSASNVLVTDVTEDQDSVRFEYTRATTYRLLGVVSAVAITIYVLEPAGQPTYVLNKERDGYNMSGDWNGWMFSQYLQRTEHVDMYMDQQGTFFDGNLQSSFGAYTFLGDVTNGALEGAGFFFAGMAPFEGSQYPFRFDGEFVTPDSIAGLWQITIPGGNDSGTFAFGRRF